MTIAALGLVDDEEIALDLAALALSELDHPGTNIGVYVDLLQQIGDRLLLIGADAETTQDQAAALATVLGGDFGFRGDVSTYDAPLNGDMIRVLDRRRGLPVSLAILYVAAARRQGWSAEALNIPGHVLVRVGEAPGLIIDPFDDGSIVEPDKLVQFLQRALSAGVSAGTEGPGPMSNRHILLRLLMNQATRAEEAADPGRAMTLYERMTLIAPGNPDGWWSLGRLQIAAGRPDEARKTLTSLLEITRDEDRRRHVTAVLEKLATT